MRITIVQGAFFPVPPVRGGAVEKIWYALGKIFAAQGHQVTHLSRSFPGLPREETIDGVHHLRISGYDAPSSLMLLKLLDLLYSLRILSCLPAGDILVTNTFWLPILLRTEKFGRLYVHVARYPRGQMRYYRHAARIQTVSPPIMDAIIRETPSLASRVRTIPNPVSRAPATASSLREPQRREILYVGRLHPEKGVHLLIEAFKRLPAEQHALWRLVLVGPAEASAGGGGETYAQSLRSAAEPIATKVEWAGAIYEPAALGEYYRRASLFVYPSIAERGETFGVAPLEAMSFGCPALVSSLACFATFIEPEINGFIFDHRVPDPSGALATALSKLLSAPETLSTAGIAAKTKADEFCNERIADLYLSDFQSLIGGRAVPPAT